MSQQVHPHNMIDKHNRTRLQINCKYFCQIVAIFIGSYYALFWLVHSRFSHESQVCCCGTVNRFWCSLMKKSFLPSAYKEPSWYTITLSPEDQSLPCTAVPGHAMPSRVSLGRSSMTHAACTLRPRRTPSESAMVNGGMIAALVLATTPTPRSTGTARTAHHIIRCTVGKRMAPHSAPLAQARTAPRVQAPPPNRCPLITASVAVTSTEEQITPQVRSTPLTSLLLLRH